MLGSQTSTFKDFKKSPGGGKITGAVGQDGRRKSITLSTANSAADRAGGVFAKDYALGMVQKWPAKTEIMRWAPIRGFVVVVSSMYGVGEIVDSAGVEITTDA